MQLKCKGNKISVKNLVATLIATFIVKLGLLFATYYVLKDLYVSNEYLTIIFTIILVLCINECDVEIEMK